MKSNDEAYHIRKRVEWHLVKKKNKKISKRKDINKAIAIVVYELADFYFKILHHCRRIKDEVEAESESGQSSLEFLALINDLSELLETHIEAEYTCDECDSDVVLRHNDEGRVLKYFIKWLYLDKNRVIERSFSEWEELINWYIRPCLTYKCQNEKCGYSDLICFVDGRKAEWGHVM